MKHFFALLIFFNVYVTASAQYLHLNLAFGTTNYSGDLQPARYTFQQSHAAVALGLSYDVSEKFSIRSQITLGKISGHDKFNPATAVRNLNFTSSLSELHIAGEYYLRDLSEHSLSPYIFGGIAVYHFNPFTKDTTGNTYFLQPLSTEGQGFFGDRKSYKLTQIAIPFGAGIKLAISENIRIGIEVGMRKAFTDYLDDLSTTYVDPTLLAANRGPKAVELAYRENELKNNVPYQTGANRGGAKYKDWYYFTGFTTSIRLGSGGGRSRANLGCPTRIN